MGFYAAKGKSGEAVLRLTLNRMENEMAKAQKTKIPRTVAGLKIPKELRKAGKVARDLSKKPLVADIAAAAMMAAAASLAKSKAGRSAGRETAQVASDAAGDALAIGSAVKRALIDAARSLLDNYESKAAKPPKAKTAKIKKAAR